MAQVTFDPAVGGDGSTVSDDINPTTGLAASGGHRRLLVPAFAQIVAIAQWVKTTALTVLGYKNSADTSAAAAADSASAAAASASTALNAPGTAATSATVLTVGTGSKSLTVQAGKLFTGGMPVMIALATNPTSVWMYGQVSSYNSGTGALVVNVTATLGSGSSGNWSVFLVGPQGVTGATGTTDWNGLINKPATFPASNRPLYVVNTNTNAVVGADYLITAAINLTLPATWAANDRIGVMHYSGTITGQVLRNGKTINGKAEDITLSQPGSFSITYTDASNGLIASPGV